MKLFEISNFPGFSDSSRNEMNTIKQFSDLPHTNSHSQPEAILAITISNDMGTSNFIQFIENPMASFPLDS